MTPQQILDDTTCLNCLDDRTLQLVVAGALLLIAEQGGSSMTPQQIITAYPCVACLDDRTLQLVAAGGILQIVNNPSSGSALSGYDGASALASRTQHSDGNLAYLNWATTEGDGAQGWFRWDASSTAADDGGASVVRATDNPFPAAGAWVRMS